MAEVKVTKDGVSNNIIATLENAKKIYPESDGYTCEEVIAPAKSQQEKEADARLWRDSELQETDALSLLTDYPKKTELAAYRTKLRDWPSTSDFPDTKPELGS